MSTARALILRAPGINRDHDLAHAFRLAGFEADLVHINQLIKQPSRLLEYHLLGIPGGFAYGDDLGAGTLLAKNITVHLSQEIRQFIDEGRLVFGVCNGFQTLVRAGLLPGVWMESDNAPAATLTDNALKQFECRWVHVAPQAGPCVFTRGIEGPIEMPVAHGEGQFVLANQADLARLQASGQAALVYTVHTRSASPSPTASTLQRQEVPYPANPNGSPGNIAGVCNARGTVFGLMPHPENFVHAIQHPQRRDGTEGQVMACCSLKMPMPMCRSSSLRLSLTPAAE